MVSRGMHTTFYDDQFRHSTKAIYYLNNLGFCSVDIIDRKD
jgi:hypothetical protein